MVTSFTQILWFQIQHASGATVGQAKGTIGPQDRPSQVLHDEVTVSPLIPTAAATVVAQRQLAATDATVADLRREM